MSQSTMSILAAALEASRKSRYSAASQQGKGAANGSANTVAADVDLSDEVRFPLVTDVEVSQMCASIAPALAAIRCYDIMGSSTQVVVVEENSLLTIPFIAAQETQVSTCFVWSSERRRYTGVLSITEYVKVLLYCESNPQEVERISNMTVREWLEIKRNTDGHSMMPGDNSAPEVLVSATADENLAICIQRMLSNKVRRLAVVADDADDPRYETSILTVITFDILMQSVASRLFATDIFGTASSSSGGRASNDDGSMSNLPPRVLSIVSGGNGDGAEDDSTEVLGGAVASATGAYRTIFDVPYARLSRLGRAARHKAQHGAYPAAETVTINTPISQALRLLIDRSLHSVAVVDESSGTRVIVDTVTRNDAIRMETGGVFNLQITVGEALSHTTGGAGNVRPAVAVFYESDTLRAIIEHFALKRVPVLFMVDPRTDAIIGQLSISEVFTFLSENIVSAL